MGNGDGQAGRPGLESSVLGNNSPGEPAGIVLKGGGQGPAHCGSTLCRLARLVAGAEVKGGTSDGTAVVVRRGLWNGPQRAAEGRKAMVGPGQSTRHLVWVCCGGKQRELGCWLRGGGALPACMYIPDNSALWHLLDAAAPLVPPEAAGAVQVAVSSGMEAACGWLL